METSSYPHYHEESLRWGERSYVLSVYNGTPGLPTLLFLPGTMVHPLFYDPFLSHIAESGINVIGLHFICHGKSPRMKEYFTVNDLVANARHALDHCREVYGENLIVMGSSQGSIIAVETVRNMNLKALFLHDLALPQLDESFDLLNLPGYVRPFRKAVLGLTALVAKLFPRYPVKLQSYLEPERVTGAEWLIRAFLDDPLTRKSYPLAFINSLLNLNLTSAVDGSLHCPVVVVTAAQDPLFTQSYMERIYSLLVTPSKEMMTFELPYHTLFVEGAEVVSQPVTEKLLAYFDPPQGWPPTEDNLKGK